MKKIFSLLILVIACISGFSQDNDAAAKTYYINAEEFFNKGSLGAYDSCITELEKAEKTLGTTNSKILYLKIKAMSQSAFAYYDPYYVYDLDRSIKKFFQITDSKNYPEDKYSEIVNLNDVFKRNLKKQQADSFYNTKYSDSALFWRGNFYMDKGLPQLGEIYLIKSANSGNLSSVEELGYLYSQKSTNDRYTFSADREKNCQNAEYWYGKLASAEHPWAWMKLGEMYYSLLKLPCCLGLDLYKGQDITNNPIYIKKATPYFILASNNHIDEAFYWLGNMSSSLVGIHADYSRALQYYLSASSSASGSFPEEIKAKASAAISDIYKYGYGVKKDRTLSAEWSQKALNANNAFTKFNNGMVNERAKLYNGAIEDFQEAINSDSTYIDPYLILAKAYMNLNKNELAVNYFKIARSKDSLYFQPYLILFSKALADIRKFEEALKAINEFLSLKGFDKQMMDEALYQKDLYEKALKNKNGNS